MPPHTRQQPTQALDSIQADLGRARRHWSDLINARQGARNGQPGIDADLESELDELKRKGVIAYEADETELAAARRDYIDAFRAYQAAVEVHINERGDRLDAYVKARGVAAVPRHIQCSDPAGLFERAQRPRGWVSRCLARLERRR